jgi:hypothetical protein
LNESSTKFKAILNERAAASKYYKKDEYEQKEMYASTYGIHFMFRYFSI